MFTYQDKAAWQNWQASQQGRDWSRSNSTTTPTPTIGSQDLPNFLPANNNGQLKELSSLMNKLPGYYDTKALEQTYDQQGQFIGSLGKQASGNASREFINRQSLQGGDRSLGGLVRAQSMLPFLQQQSDLMGKKESAKLDASSALAKVTAETAASLGQLRTSYLGTLANYTTNQNQLNTQTTLERERQKQQQGQFNQNLGLDRERLNLQRTNADRQYGLDAQQAELQRLLALQRVNQGNSRSTTIDWGDSLGSYSALR